MPVSFLFFSYTSFQSLAAMALWPQRPPAAPPSAPHAGLRHRTKLRRRAGHAEDRASGGPRNRPALGCAGEANEKGDAGEGDAGDRAGTVTGVSLHFTAQIGQAEVPETQRKLMSLSGPPPPLCHSPSPTTDTSLRRHARIHTRRWCLPLPPRGAAPVGGACLRRRARIHSRQRCLPPPPRMTPRLPAEPPSLTSSGDGDGGFALVPASQPRVLLLQLSYHAAHPRCRAARRRQGAMGAAVASRG
jgi:hypothetical protein